MPTTTSHVRLITAVVRAVEMGKAKEALVSLRFPIELDKDTGIMMATHSCIASACPDCHADLLDKADGKLGMCLDDATARVTVLRDRQATTNKSPMAEQEAEATRLREEANAFAKREAELKKDYEVARTHVRKARKQRVAA